MTRGTTQYPWLLVAFIYQKAYSVQDMAEMFKRVPEDKINKNKNIMFKLLESRFWLHTRNNLQMIRTI